MRRVSLWILPLTIAVAPWGILIGEPVHASVNVPLHHWTYDAIERLTAMGIIDRAMIVPKPYSRKQAAGYVARAIERIRAGEIRHDGREAIAEPLLLRLMEHLRPELTELGVLGARRVRARAAPPHPVPHPAGERDGGGKGQEGERTKVRGEWLGAIRIGGRIQQEVAGFWIEQGETRFRENRMGQYYADGPQARTDVRTWLELGEWVALSARPEFISDPDLLGTDNSRQIFLQELNAKFVIFNLAFEIGRGSLWWGPGSRGSLLLTDHAFPLDMVRLGSDEPFRLPWIFGSLGDWKVNSFWGQLERDRDFPRANVFGLRLSYLPASWLELGATRLTQFNGRGRGQSFPDAVFDAYSNAPNQTGDQDVNEQFMLDFRARIPPVPYLVPFPGGLQLYGELGSEDKWSKVPIPSRAAFLAGLYVPQVFSGDTLDLRIEYADTDYTRRKTGDHLERVWYNNGTYKSGMRFKGQPLGHWMGTDAIDLFVRSTRFLTAELQLGAHAEWLERDRGQPVHETKREAGVDLTWWLSPQAQLSLAYVYQRIKNPGTVTNIGSSINPFSEQFAAGRTSNNHLFWTTFSYQF